MKIGLLSAVALAGLTAVFYVSVTATLKESIRQNVESRVARAQRIFSDISQLSGLKLANLASARARSPQVLAVFDKTDPAARQSGAYEVCEGLNQQLKQDGRKADIVAILDASGKIVGRDLNPNADVGLDLRAKYPAVGQALKGVPVKDVWTWQDRVHEIAVAPVVKTDNSVVGAVLFAWVVSAVTAQSNRDLLDTEVGFFHAGKVYASSFVSNEDKSKEDIAKSQALSTLLFSGEKLAESALHNGTPTPVKTWEIEGREFVAVAAPMPGNFADKTSGFVVLASLSDGMADVHAAGMKVFWLGLLAIVVALVAAVLTARRFVAPLDEIELGVAEIINGNIDYTWKPVGQDFEGLSNSLNVMLARLLGREEPNEEAVEEEDDGGKQTWKAEAMVIEETDGSAPAATVASLAEEEEAAYYPRLFGEYLSTLRKLGQPSEGLSVLAFMAKLSLTEAGLREKWECKVVRFLLAAQGSQISFRPVKIS
ncbi:MAG TPA: hypothetical protein VIM14_04050 [Polyangia bacterium]|jgi:hypothetical protein